MSNQTVKNGLDAKKMKLPQMKFFLKKKKKKKIHVTISPFQSEKF